MADEFTHLTDSGVHMVEVGAKPDQKRRAIASGSIFLDSHPLALTGIELDFEVKEDEIVAKCSVNTLGKTGVEMEAITGVSVALLTVWDMVKAVEKDENGQYPDTRISDIKVIKKEKI